MDLRAALADDVRHLHRAERRLALLRAAGLASFALILDPADYTASSTAVASVYAASLAYGVLTFLHVRRRRAVLAGAIATTLLDACVVAAICAVTGGLESDFFAFLYMTVVAISVRFAPAAAAAMLGVNALLAAGLWLLVSTPAPVPASELGLRIFYLGFATALGSMLSRDARAGLAAARSAAARARELSRRLIDVEEEQRRRMAGELHDRTGPRFFELYYAIDRARGALAPEQRETDRALESLGREARACGDEVRELMNSLRPAVLDDFGASEAVRELAESLRKSGELEIDARIDPDANAARPEVNVALFRIAQEAVLNARKHAAARTLSLALFRAEPALIVLEVRDDGRGFVPGSPARGHLGLLHMRERAAACGGRLSLSSIPGRGTLLRIEMPADVEDPACASS